MELSVSTSLIVIRLPNILYTRLLHTQKTPNLLTKDIMAMARFSCFLGLLLFGYFQTSAAKIVTHHFNIGWISAKPDGFVRPVVAINGQFPAPTIHVTVGDELEIHAVNNLGNSSLTLHFHGIFQEGSTAQDGPFQVSQCGVPPGQSFTYRFFVGAPTTTIPLIELIASSD